VGNVGPEKLLLLFVVALIVLGPSKLPEAARTLGKVIGEFRRISGGFQAEMRDAFLDPVAATRENITAAFSSPSTVHDGGAVAQIPPTESDPPTPVYPPTRPELPAPPDDPSLN
jgi:sec-independent protein translocase protein TatB